MWNRFQMLEVGTADVKAESARYDNKLFVWHLWPKRSINPTG
jgi:hypothetical protein